MGGAALRNRDYDKEEGDDQEPLERALTAIISVPCLAGPLKKQEIDFFITWLALAYRSKSPVLGYGDDKPPVAIDSFCVHQEDGSLKYKLGGRPLPGKTKPLKGIFEPWVEEMDDYLKNPLSVSPLRKSKKSRLNNQAFREKAEVEATENNTAAAPRPVREREKKEGKKAKDETSEEDSAAAPLPVETGQKKKGKKEQNKAPEDNIAPPLLPAQTRREKKRKGQQDEALEDGTATTPLPVRRIRSNKTKEDEDTA